MDKNIIKSIIQRVENIRDITRNTYTMTVSNLLSAQGGGLPLDINAIMKKIKLIANRHSRKLQYASLQVLIKAMTEHEVKTYFGTKKEDVQPMVSNAAKELSAEIKKVYIEQKMSASERAKWEDWPVVENVWTTKMKDPIMPKDYDAKNLYEIQVFSIVGLYIVLSPVRNDYRTLRIDTVSPKYNYVLVNDAKRIITIVLNEYKTSTKYGQIKLYLNASDSPNHERLYKAMANLILARKEIKGTYLFANQKGTPEPLSTTSYSQILTGVFERYLQRPLGSQMLRKIYLSHLQRDEPSLVDKMNTAKAMGHSTEMQALYRRIK
jgi:hypothetical protein